jgi:hypothetical protein
MAVIVKCGKCDKDVSLWVFEAAYSAIEQDAERNDGTFDCMNAMAMILLQDFFNTHSRTKRTGPYEEIYCKGCYGEDMLKELRKKKIIDWQEIVELKKGR